MIGLVFGDLRRVVRDTAVDVGFTLAPGGILGILLFEIPYPRNRGSRAIL